MKTNPSGQSWGRGLLCILVALGVFSQCVAQAQVQRKPKAPKPPSYDEVMQRALSEKKTTTNPPVVSAPVVVQPTPKPEPAPVPAPEPSVATTNKPPPMSLDALLKEAKTSKAQVAVEAPVVKAAPQVKPPPPQPVLAAPSATPVAATPVAPAAPVRSEAVPPTSIEVPPTTEPTKATQPKPKSKGPVFSPLPPDLAPANEATAVHSSVARSVTPTNVDTTNAMDTLDDKHVLAIGDRLSFRIVEDEEDPRSLTVMDSGELEVPHIGRFAAAGKSCKELARALKAELEKEYYYKATVIIAVDQMTKSRGKVYLVGAVRMPGPQEIPSDEVLTLSKAILRAGGFTDFADKKNVKVTRKTAESGDQTFRVNVEEILEKGKTEADLPLLPGDLIYVPERLVRF